MSLLLLPALSMALFSVQAHAYIQGNGFLCVNDSGALGADFQAALDEISSDNRPDSNLRLIGGTFTIPSDPHGHFSIEANHSLAISGGWNADCSTQTLNPQLSILQGGTTQVNPGGVLAVTILDNSSPATVSISNLTVQNGSSELDGGGINFEHDLTGTAALATLNIADVIAQSNATATFGSGIAVYDWGTNGGLNVNISDCIVHNNSVPINSDGGPAGIYIDSFGSDIEVAISRCQILDNMAELDGGGLYINSASGNVTLVNNVIAGNSVSDDNGGGIYIINAGGGDFTLTNNTVTENETTGTTVAFRDGGGLYVELNNNSSKLDIYNNIIFNNSAAGDGDDIFIYNPNGNEVDIKNNDFSTSEPSGFSIESKVALSQENNLNDIPPLFANAATGDYHLTSLSPVIAMGKNSAPAVPADDLDGLPRPVNGTVDMGAYEYQGAASTTTTTSTSSTTTTTTTTTLPGGTTTTTTLPATTTTSTSSTTTTTTTSTTLPGSTTTTTIPSNGGGGGGCFIATAANGSHLADPPFSIKTPAAGYLVMLLGIFLAGAWGRKPDRE